MAVNKELGNKLETLFRSIFVSKIEDRQGENQTFTFLETSRNVKPLIRFSINYTAMRRARLVSVKFR